MYSNGTRNYLAALNNPAFDPNLPVHPTFLYEFIGNLIIYFFLINVRKKTKEAYEPLAWYLVLYGTLRFFVENIRTDSLYIGDTDIRVSALLSALMVIAGVAYLIYTRFSSNRLVRRAEMAALLTATPENTDTETVAANVAGTDEVDHYESEAETEAETVDVEADVNEALPVNEDNEDADMDRLIREAREAATRALAKDQADNLSSPETDPEAGSEKRS
jgi:phosphatidylglycerol:prolipoprotein diacylglycerol transferase